MVQVLGNRHRFNLQCSRERRKAAFVFISNLKEFFDSTHGVPSANPNVSLRMILISLGGQYITIALPITFSWGRYPQE
jgi:hypothetical protein